MYVPRGSHVLAPLINFTTCHLSPPSLFPRCGSSSSSLTSHTRLFFRESKATARSPGSKATTRPTTTGAPSSLTRVPSACTTVRSAGKIHEATRDGRPVWGCDTRHGSRVRSPSHSGATNWCGRATVPGAAERMNRCVRLHPERTTVHSCDR